MSNKYSRIIRKEHSLVFLLPFYHQDFKGQVENLSTGSTQPTASNPRLKEIESVPTAGDETESNRPHPWHS